MLTLINVNLTINPHAAEASPFISFFVKKIAYYIYLFIFLYKTRNLKVKNSNKTLNFN